MSQAPSASLLTRDRPSILDAPYELLLSGQVHAGMKTLVRALRSRRLESELEDWSDFVQSECLTHPIRRLLHQDPFTWRCFSKPRGYAGDAVMLDHIYYSGELAAGDPSVSTLGKEINLYTTNGPAPRAVRYRGEFIARSIDACAESGPSRRIVSVGCGHLREIEFSRAAAAGALGDFAALDQDAESLQTVRRDYADRYGVTAVHGSVRALLTGRVRFARQHLVYAAGLFDYLEQRTARRLTSVLFDMLDPGGRVVIANFLPGIEDVGYMESYMAWPLVYRTSQQLLALSHQFGQGATSDLVLDPESNIGFLTITRN